MAFSAEGLLLRSGPRPRRSSSKRILVATDRSESAARAVDWAARMAALFDAELHLIQVLVPEDPPPRRRGQPRAAGSVRPPRSSRPSPG
jgi:nucleotide-binding universal stress UspA family protein